MKHIYIAIILSLGCCLAQTSVHHYTDGRDSARKKQQAPAVSPKKRNAPPQPSKVSSEKLAALKARLAPALALSANDLQFALKLKFHETYYGAAVIGDDDDHTFLGTITNSFDSNSIFNTVGTHGSDVSSTSIWNDVCRFGGDVSPYSPFNEVALHPPIIIKDGQVIGKLTVNDYSLNAVNPYLLKALLGD